MAEKSNETGDSPNFYDARLRRQTTVDVGGHPSVLTTLAFFNNLVFENKREAYSVSLADKKETPVNRYNRLKELLDAGKVNWRQCSIQELPALAATLVELNKLPPKLAWQLPSADQQPDTKKGLSSDDQALEVEDSTAYPGREIAGFVTLLADVFGWTADHILNELGLYEVNCYIQEALIIKHQEKEFSYNLAEVGFQKVGEKYEKMPFPAMSWDSHKTVLGKEFVAEAKKNLLPERFRPDGLIVDYTKSGQQPIVSEVKRDEADE